MKRQGRPSSSWAIILRVEYDNKVGRLGALTSAIGRAAGDISSVDLVDVVRGRIRRDITINARDHEHEHEIVETIKALSWVKLLAITDRVFLAHRGGKIVVNSKIPIRNRTDLSVVYTPGVARVCEAIHDDPRKAFTLTIKRNTAAIVTDGSAVLGLGDIGPLAALPVMEGKAALCKEFGGVDAFPLCLEERDVDKLVATIKSLAPSFGVIHLEDISAPRCFEVEAALCEQLTIPVFHDDQHCTATVVLAALMNALKLVKKKLANTRIVIAGAGASATGCARLLVRAGARHIVIGDTKGIIYQGRKEHMTPMKQWLAEHTNPEGLQGNLRKALTGADVCIGLATPGALSVAGIRKMAKDAIVFVLANPIPEVAPEEIEHHVRIVATGRSDYANQINNVLCFPGLLRGLLDCRAQSVTSGMFLAAAKAIAKTIKSTELQEDYIIPAVFNSKVVQEVAHAVAAEAQKAGIVRHELPHLRL
jgi:malate dehydrogenase (oxaloacetate-decarboxylating)